MVKTDLSTEKGANITFYFFVIHVIFSIITARTINFLHEHKQHRNLQTC